MIKKDYSNIGNDIKTIVQDALNSTDFKELNKNITETVNRALDEVKRSSQYWQEQQKQNNAKMNAQQAAYKKQQENAKLQQRQQMVAKDNSKNFNNLTKKQQNALVSKSPHGSVSGVLLTVFGNIGIGLSILFFLILAFLSNFAFQSLTFLGVATGVLLPIFIISTLMAAKGSGLRARVKRFRQYASRLNGRTFCKIQELSEPIGRSNKYVVKDLRKMIRFGMFPKGRIDEDESYLLISDEAYESHLKMKEGKRLQEEKEKSEKEAIQRQKSMEAQNPGMKAVNDVIAEGKNTIRLINEANAAIPGEGISRKLDRLEIVISKIFEFIEENPDEVPEIRKFMGYYLPTTLKLVGVYKDLDAEPIQGANIMATKKEIEDTLDTISHAFENLLDGFYEETAMDVSTDISVLNTMFAQEGLSQKDFK